jgi:hypothetical protein
VWRAARTVLIEPTPTEFELALYQIADARSLQRVDAEREEVRIVL